MFNLLLQKLFCRRRRRWNSLSLPQITLEKEFIFQSVSSFVNMDQPRPLLFNSTIIPRNTEYFCRIRTWTVGLEGEPADHLTTTKAQPFYLSLFMYPLSFFFLSFTCSICPFYHSIFVPIFLFVFLPAKNNVFLMHWWTINLATIASVCLCVRMLHPSVTKWMADSLFYCTCLWTFIWLSWTSCKLVWVKVNLFNSLFNCNRHLI